MSATTTPGYFKWGDKDAVIESAQTNMDRSGSTRVTLEIHVRGRLQMEEVFNLLKQTLSAPETQKVMNKIIEHQRIITLEEQ